MTKNGYTYRFSELKRSPKGFENIDFLQYTLDSMHLASDYGEWEQLHDSIVSEVKLPDVSGYRPDLLSFNVHYNEGKHVANEVVYTFDNDETDFYFGVYEDGYTFDMLSYTYDSLRKQRISEQVTSLQLDNKQELSRHLFSEAYKVAWIIYRWAVDGLQYYLTVKDDRMEYVEDIDRYEEEFLQLIESVGKPN